MYMTPAEAADLLRTTRAGVYGMIERGLLPGVSRVGLRRMLIHRDTVLDWLRQKRAPSLKE